MMDNHQNPPGPPRKIFAGHLAAMRRDAPQFLARLAREYGDVSCFHIGSLTLYLLNHPDLIRDVLVTHNRRFMKSEALQRAKRVLGEGLLTSEGELHLRQRRLIQPAFHRERIKGYARAMSDYARRTAERWDELGSGVEVDMSREMMRLTLGVVGKTLFDFDVEGEAKKIGAALDSVMEDYELLNLPFWWLLERLPLPRTRRFNASREYLDGIIYGMIEERRKDKRDRGDLLSMLLLAQDEDLSTMTDRQVRDEAMTIFLAGHETTANALMWTWYLLSQNPGAEVKLHAELDAVLAGRAAAYEDVERLAYTRMVFAESMRLYPPAWALGRRALEEHQAGEYSIPVGSIVLMSQWVMHRDARYYPDPEKFDPERWTPQAQEARPRYCYFPFSYGVRQCIGEAFAWMEGVLLLATLAQKWRARLVPDHRVVLRPMITLRARYGMKMTLHRRGPGQ
jgi:cytochrome P450